MNSDNISDEKIQKLVLTSAASDSEHLQDAVSKAVLSRSVSQYRYPFETGLSYGSAGLGSTGDRPQLSQEDLSRHLLVVGQSGSGKTTLLRNLMGEIEKPFWAFDLKQDYRHLSRDVLVVPWNELKFNPLRPPEGVSPMRWAQVFSEVFCHATALLSGSKNYILKQVVRLYKLYNLFDGVSEPFPSLFELEMLLSEESVRGRKQSGCSQGHNHG